MRAHASYMDVGNHSHAVEIIMTKKRNWKRGWLKVVGIGTVVLILLVIGFFWMIRQAFGPTERVGELELSNELSLQFQETFSRITFRVEKKHP
ncbi:MAG: hypothetical protein GY816_23000 [Cytophagales bacterium]|nr:hypothetical protein [Cytophagales bacterium]